MSDIFERWNWFDRFWEEGIGTILIFVVFMGPFSGRNLRWSPLFVSSTLWLLLLTFFFFARKVELLFCYVFFPSRPTYSILVTSLLSSSLASTLCLIPSFWVSSWIPILHFFWFSSFYTDVMSLLCLLYLMQQSFFLRDCLFTHQ